MRFSPALVTALCVAGCASYAQIELADVADYEEVRVTLTDGERQQVLEPQVDADSIWGQLEQGGRPIGAFAAPMGQLAAVEASQPSSRNTTMLVAGIAVGAALLFFAAYLAIVNDPNY